MHLADRLRGHKAGRLRQKHKQSGIVTDTTPSSNFMGTFEAE